MRGWWVLLAVLGGCVEDEPCGEGEQAVGFVNTPKTILTCDLGVQGALCRNNAFCGVCQDGDVLSGYQRSDECRWDWQWSAGAVVGYGGELEQRCVEQDGPLNTRTDLR